MVQAHPAVSSQRAPKGVVEYRDLVTPVKIDFGEGFIMAEVSEELVRRGHAYGRIIGRNVPVNFQGETYDFVSRPSLYVALLGGELGKETLAKIGAGLDLGSTLGQREYEMRLRSLLSEATMDFSLSSPNVVSMIRDGATRSLVVEVAMRDHNRFYSAVARTLGDRVTLPPLHITTHVAPEGRGIVLLTQSDFAYKKLAELRHTKR